MPHRHRPDDPLPTAQRAELDAARRVCMSVWWYLSGGPGNVERRFLSQMLDDLEVWREMTGRRRTTDDRP